MPRYEYACTACGHQFDVFQSFSDDALTSCPECEGRLRKLFNAVGVVFKGSGFYRTDSRASATSGASNGSSTSSSSDSGAAKSSSESSASPASSGPAKAAPGSSASKKVAAGSAS